MNSKVMCLAAFTIGTAAGSAATWQFFKKKYERIVEEEIRSVKETYSKREAVVMKPVDGVTADQARKRKESVVAYAARLR